MLRNSCQPYQPNHNVQPTGRSVRIKKSIRAVIIGGTIFGLTACSSIYWGSTDYAKSNPDWGSMYGYNDKRIDEDEFSVVVRGNPVTSKERVAEIALLRAAYITQEQGKTYFLIEKEKTELMGAEELVSLPLPLGGLPVWVPVGSKATKEPTAILLIRILATQAQYPSDALDAAEVIKLLSKQLE